MTQNAQQQPNGGTSPDESLTPDQIQRIIQVGEHASALLQSPVYNLAYNNVLSSLYQQWLGSDAKEERKRESLYHQAQGLINVTEHLAGAVDDAQRQIELQAEQNDPRRQAQQYQDEQGFGLNLQ